MPLAWVSVCSGCMGMISQVLAWLGLLVVGLIAVHWVLGAALRSGTQLPSPLRSLHHLLDNWSTPLDADRRADRRRQARVLRAQLQRDAIARASVPVPLDPPIEWDGNVAHAQFGRKPAQRPHNLH
jgi:hypothetical protein